MCCHDGPSNRWILAAPCRSRCRGAGGTRHCRTRWCSRRGGGPRAGRDTARRAACARSRAHKQQRAVRRRGLFRCPPTASQGPVASAVPVPVPVPVARAVAAARQLRARRRSLARNFPRYARRDRQIMRCAFYVRDRPMRHGVRSCARSCRGRSAPLHAPHARALGAGAHRGHRVVCAV